LPEEEKATKRLLESTLATAEETEVEEEADHPGYSIELKIIILEEDPEAEKVEEILGIDTEDLDQDPDLAADTEGMTEIDTALDPGIDTTDLDLDLLEEDKARFHSKYMRAS
jgi:hypothetical protein